MILCCGEALIDMIATETQGSAKAFVPHTGGSVYNTAIALGRLEIPVALLSGVSRDMFGAMLVSDLQQSRVDVSMLVRDDRPTTLAFVEVVNGQAQYAFFDENTAGRMLRAEAITHDLSGYRVGYFGGISLACEPCADAYTALAKQLAPDRVIMLDPNVRPMFITNQQRYRTRMKTMMSLADIVKVSDEDLDWLIPEAMSPDDKLAQILKLGASAVIMTQGKDGAMVRLANGARIEVQGRLVTVVDTVGAGDTFNAGVLARLHQLGVLEKTSLSTVSASQWQSALEWGIKVASVTVSRSGANPPHLSEINP